jgi:fucose permease
MSNRAAAPTVESTALTDARAEWASLHAGFVLIGISMTMLGPLLPYFTHHWSITEGQVGRFFSTLYLGSLVGTLLTSSLLPRLGFSRVISAGYFCFALGLALLGIGPWYFSAVFVAIYGLGYGLANPSISLRATNLPSSNVAAAVSLLNFSWGIGAVLAPFLVAYFLGHLSFRALTMSLALSYVALSLLHYVRKTDAPAAVEARPKQNFALLRARLQPAPWISLAMLFFLYVGVEISVGGWVALDEKQLGGVTISTLSASAALFYGFLLLGRFLVPWELKRLSQRELCVTGLVLAVIGVSIVALAQSPGLLYVGAAFAGFGCAPQYPIYVTWLAAIFKDDSTWLGALFFGAAGLGSSIVPWLVGVVASQTHSLRIGFLLPLVSALCMIPFALRACPGTHSTARAPV